MRRSNPNRKIQLDINEKDIIYCNWLKKQGGKFKTLKKRYFILVKNVLYYFTNQTRNLIKGQINLKNLELSELEEDKANNEYNFYILPEIGKDFVNEGHIKYVLSTNDKKEADEWIFYLKQSMYLERGGGLFGRPLSMVMPYLKSEFCYVPRIVFECCQYIRQFGMDEEGIFRKNGQLSLVLQIKEKVDRAIYDWEDIDIHTVCSLLKMYLRELPEPVIPFSNYDSLKAVGYRIDVGENLGLVKEKLYMLPYPNLQLLKYLCEFLIEVSQHSANRMEISSLAKVFSPNILRDQDTDPYVEETTNSVITVTVAAFIKSQSELFQFEFEPLRTFEEDPSARDEDTYSLKSALSFINVNNLSSSESFCNRNAGPFPQRKVSPSRVQSMILLNDSLSERSRSQDTLVLPKPELVEYCEKTPVSTKKLSLANGSLGEYDDCGECGDQDRDLGCAQCRELARQLDQMTRDRDRVQRLFEIKTRTCTQLQDEIDSLRIELVTSKRLRHENTSDLSDILEHFNINKY